MHGAWPVPNLAADALPATVSLPLVGFTGSATATPVLGGISLPRATVSAASAAAATLRTVLKTPTVYVDDSTVSVAYSLADAAGRLAVAPVSISAGSKSGTCDAVLPNSPVGTCTLDVGVLVASSVSVTVKLSNGAAPVASKALTVAYVAPPAVQPSSQGLYVKLPMHPAYQGDVVTAQVWMRASTQVQGVVVTVVAAPASALAFASFSGPLFGQVVAGSSVPGTVVVNLLQSNSFASTTGSFLLCGCRCMAGGAGGAGGCMSGARRGGSWAPT